MDFGKAFTHAFEDEEWPTKIIVGTLIMMVPILNFAAIGYQIRLARNVAKGVKRPLPDWSDLGGCFVDGLWMALASFAYTLPLTLFAVFPAPLILFAIIFCINDERACAFIPLILLLLVVTLLISLFGALVLSLLRPGITARFVQEGTFVSCFQLGAIMGFITRNLGSYALVYALNIVLGILVSFLFSPLSMVLSFLPCLGPWLATLLLTATLFVTFVITGHMIGQLVSIDLAASPDDIPPLVKPN